MTRLVYIQWVIYAVHGLFWYHISPQSVIATLSQFGGLNALQIPEAMPAGDLTPGRFTRADHGGQVILNLYASDFKYQPFDIHTVQRGPAMGFLPDM